MNERRESDDISPSEMANRGVEKDLEGYADAFRLREVLKEQEEAAEKRRLELRQRRKLAAG